MWQILEKIRLDEFIKQMAEQLDTKITSSKPQITSLITLHSHMPLLECTPFFFSDGDNFSVGQKQLLCLGRVLLHKEKKLSSLIIVMDESTASMDSETDQLIQQMFRRELLDCTVLTIAHRINTIIDSDKIVVVHEGEVVEFGPPHKLLLDKSSVFYQMAR